MKITQTEKNRRARYRRFVRRPGYQNATLVDFAAYEDRQAEYAAQYQAESEDQSADRETKRLSHNDAERLAHLELWR